MRGPWGYAEAVLAVGTAPARSGSGRSVDGPAVPAADFDRWRTSWPLFTVTRSTVYRAVERAGG